jgi:hypothetical protein
MIKALIGTITGVAVTAGFAMALVDGFAGKPIATAERYAKTETISAAGPGKFQIVFEKISGMPKLVTDIRGTYILAANERMSITVTPCADFAVYNSNPFGLSRVNVSEIRVSEWRECYPAVSTN